MLKRVLIVACLMMTAGAFPSPGPGRAPYILPPAASFVSLAESTTFGPSGTIADLTGRFAVPEYVGPPPDLSGWTQDTSLKDGGCSSDDTTWVALKTAITAAGDNTRIWLPDDCKTLAFVTPSTSDSFEYAIPASKDGLALWCDDPTVCGIEFRYRASGSPQWDYNAGAAYGDQLQVALFSVGGSASAAQQTCGWTAGYAVGSKMLQTDCTISHSGTNAWGPDDIIMYTTDGITGFGTTKPTPISKVTCVSNSSNVKSPASDPTGTLCNEITGANQIQIADPLAMDYDPNAYYWGVNSGSSYNTFPSGTSTYADTAGHTIHQLEGKSRSTPVDTIAEDIYFVGIGWSIYPEFIGGRYVRVPNAYNVTFYENKFDGRIGYESNVYTGGFSSARAGRVSFHSTDFTYGAFKTTCFTEITKIEIVDSDTLAIEYDNTGGCGYSNAGGDDSAGFSRDVDEPLLAGLAMRKTASTLVTTSPDPERRRFTVDVTDTTGANECEEGTGDPCEGLAIDLDKFDNSVVKCHLGSSNVQFVNNTFINTAQGPILESGCASYAFVNNYTFHETSWRTGRGPFFHGNSGSPGGLFEGNDQDQPFVPIESSNGPNSRHGECVACVFFKNRCTKSPATVSPAGGDYSSRGLCFTQNPEDQWGGSNEDWTMALNAGDEIYSGTSKADEASNLPDTDDATNDAPHMLYNLWYYRNRCAASGCNQDDNFDAANTSTVRDNAATDQDESATVPGGWSSEVGLEPTSLFFDAKPSWWCNEAVTFGQIGAYYDNFSGTLGKLPAQIRYEGGTCTLP